MAAEHSEIVRDLGDGWAVRWDATEISAETRAAFDELIAAEAEHVRTIVEASDDRAPALDDGAAAA